MAEIGQLSSFVQLADGVKVSVNHIGRIVYGTMLTLLGDLAYLATSLKSSPQDSK